MVVHTDINMELQLPEVTVVPSKESGTTAHHFTLPALPSDASYECHMTLKLPASWSVRKTLSDTQDQSEQLSAWKYEVIPL